MVHVDGTTKNGNTIGVPEEDCPITRTAYLVGDKWILLIVRHLIDGCLRFGELQQALGNISPKTLSQRLKMLEHAGIVSRTIYAEVPPRVEYTLTEKGQALTDIMEAMRQFGEEYLPLPDSR
ncbi:MAG: transcriptional regulator [Chloroflexi bacterium]|nr:MAG: transcriptional regulator [Chloroflexota bacterium]